VISSPRKMQSYGIDSSDALNELAVVEYVDDIYFFYKSSEVILSSLCLHSIFYDKIVKP
jgi:hypothetical protein